MATTLLDSRLLDYKDKPVKDIPLKALNISYYFIGDKIDETGKRGAFLFYREKALSELNIRETVRGKEVTRPVKSIEEYMRYLPQGKIYTEEGHKVEQNGEVVTLDGKTGICRTEPYYESFSIDVDYQTTEDIEQTKIIDDKPVVSSTGVPYGVSKTATVDEQNLSKDDNYLMIYFEGSTKQDFVKKSSIYFLEGSEIVYLYELGKSIDFERVKGKTLYCGSRVVDRIYTEKEFTFGELTKFDKVDEKKLEKSTYMLIHEPTEEDEKKLETGEVVERDGLLYEKTLIEEQDRYYSQANQVYLVVPDPKNAGKTKQESYYAVKTYEIDSTGEYVNIRLKGDNKVSMIKIDQLVDRTGERIDISNIKNYVGESILVKVGESFVETEPLTYEQAVYYYNKKYAFEPSVTTDDILGENSFLQTKTGDFVRETDVRPIAYKFSDAEHCEAYLLHVETEEGIKSKVVSAEDIEKSTKGLKVINSYYLETTDFENGQVVQTTNNGGKVNDCTVLLNYNAETGSFEAINEEDKAKIKEAVVEKFNDTYKAGQYRVEYVYDETGNKVELDPRGKRFVYTDTHYMKDYADLTRTYAGLKNSAVTYESSDGKLGEFKGNAPLSFSKLCSKGFGTWAKVLVTYLGFSVSPIGLLASLAAPFAVIGAGVVIGAMPIVIPLVSGVRCFVKNVLNRPFFDKTKHNRKKWNKDLQNELNFVNENMKENKLSKGLKQDVFLARMEKLRRDALANASSTVGNGFQFVDGKVVVTGENVNQVKQFKRIHKKELANLKRSKKQLDRLEKKLQSAYKPIQRLIQQGVEINENDKRYKKYQRTKKVFDEYQEVYQKQQDRFNRNVTNRNDEALTYAKDKKLDRNLEAIDNVQSFWHLKRFASREEILELGLTPEEIEQLDKVQYNAKNNCFEVKQSRFRRAKKFKLEDCVESKASAEETESTSKKAKKLSKRALKRQQTLAILTKYKSAMDKLSGKVVDTEEVAEPSPITETPEILDATDDLSVDREAEHVADKELSPTEETVHAEDEIGLHLEDDIESVDVEPTKTVVPDLETSVDTSVDRVITPVEPAEPVEKTTAKKPKTVVTDPKKSVTEKDTTSTKKPSADKGTPSTESTKTGKKEVKETSTKKPEDIVADHTEPVKVTKPAETDTHNEGVVIEVPADAVTITYTEPEETVVPDKKTSGDSPIEMVIETVEPTKAEKETPVKRPEDIIVDDYTEPAEYVKEDAELVESGKEISLLESPKQNEKEVEEPISKAEGENKAETNPVESEPEQKVETENKTEEITTETKVEKTQTEPVKAEEKKTQKTSKEKTFDPAINSEDALVKLLKAKEINKERQKLLDYIASKSGVTITTADIQETITRINEKHNPANGESVSAIKHASRLKNKNIFTILDYGQRYLTEYAREIKQRTTRPEETKKTTTQKAENLETNLNNNPQPTQQTPNTNQVEETVQDDGGITV